MVIYNRAEKRPDIKGSGERPEHVQREEKRMAKRKIDRKEALSKAGGREAAKEGRGAEGSFLPEGEEGEEYICEKCKTSPALPKMRFCVACVEVKDISGSGW